MELVINKCHGGFGLSPKAMKRLAELDGKEIYFYKQTKYSYKDGKDEYSKVSINEIDKSFWSAYSKDFGDNVSINEMDWKCRYNSDPQDRDNPKLVQVVKELADEASDRYAKLRVVEIPDDVNWEISEYDGLERVEEKHRSWY